MITNKWNTVNIYTQKEPLARLFFFSAIGSAYSAVRFFSEISIAGEA